MSANHPPPLPSPRRSSRWLAVVLAIVVVAGMTWMIVRPPALEAWLPRCGFYQLTGLYCPGCGGTRAVDALLHGHLLHAIRCNPITTLGLPLILVLWARWIYKLAVDRPGSTWSIHIPKGMVLGIAIGLALFMLLRNLPFAVFDVLRPPG